MNEHTKQVLINEINLVIKHIESIKIMINECVNQDDAICNHEFHSITFNGNEIPVGDCLNCNMKLKDINF